MNPTWQNVSLLQLHKSVPSNKKWIFHVNILDKKTAEVMNGHFILKFTVGNPNKGFLLFPFHEFFYRLLNVKLELFNHSPGNLIRKTFPNFTHIFIHGMCSTVLGEPMIEKEIFLHDPVLFITVLKL